MAFNEYEKYQIKGFSKLLGEPCVVVEKNGIENRLFASQLTHTKPEPDSWSSVWADVSNGNETPEGMMRRCRALAERGE